jgi:hypothetical protein
VCKSPSNTTKSREKQSNKKKRGAIFLKRIEEEKNQLTVLVPRSPRVRDGSDQSLKEIRGLCFRRETRDGEDLL